MAKPTNSNDPEVRVRAPGAAPQTSETSGWTALRFDIDEYRKFVADLGMTEAQQTAYLQALWEIAVAVVDLKFRVHPVQQVMEKETLDVDSEAVIRSVITLKQMMKESRTD
jgi:hypothetical protein